MISFSQFEELSKHHNLIPIVQELPGDLETPVSTFLKVRTGEYDFLLESVVGGERWGRYSFIGTNPRQVVTLQNSELRIYDPQKKTYETFTANEHPLNYFRKLWKQYKTYQDPRLPRFFGGWVGFVGYHAVSAFEKITLIHKPDVSVPDYCFMATDTVVIFDNLKNILSLVHPVILPEGASSQIKRQLYDEAIYKIESLRHTIQKPLPSGLVWNEQVLKNPKPKARYNRAEYVNMVLRAKSYIESGDAFQLVLSNRFDLNAEGLDPFWVYRRLRRSNPSPYMYYLGLKDLRIVGSSPEVLVRVEEGKMTVKPIAGTRPRGPSPEADAKLEAELLNDPKENAEHIMLVDLGRNDVGRVSAAGQVKVDEQKVIEKYSHVMHMVSQVSGQLASDKDCADAVSSAFPAGTLTGAPKIRAMEIIDELEGTSRGLYGGAVGYLSFGGNADLAIAIRTAVFQGDFVSVQAGAGVVYNSIPDMEYEECVNKAKAVLVAVAGQDFAIEES